MTFFRALLGASQGGGAFSPIVTPQHLLGLINGAPDGNYLYDIGVIESTDYGESWSVGGSPVITQTADAWKTIYVKDPSVVWDGTQYVCYYCGWNGSNFQVGRATAPAMTGTWTDYGSNPVFNVPNDASYRQSGALFPFLHYDEDEDPPWMLWLTGSDAGVFTIGYFDSDDGITWTDHGQVIGLGTAGEQDDTWTVIPSAVKVGATWYVYYAGYRVATGFMKAMVATTDDPTDAGSYTKLGILSGFSSTLTVGGLIYRSNAIRQVIPFGSQYIVLGDSWNASGSPTEACWRVLGSDPVTFGTPSALLAPLGGGTWHANSAENPSVVPTAP